MRQIYAFYAILQPGREKKTLIIPSYFLSVTKGIIIQTISILPSGTHPLRLPRYQGESNLPRGVTILYNYRR